VYNSVPDQEDRESGSQDVDVCRQRSTQLCSKQQLHRPPKLPRLQPCRPHRQWLDRQCHLRSLHNR